MLKTGKPKMLYIMHVSWFWIKQRPHFIAEQLIHYFNISVFSSESLIKNNQLVSTEKPFFQRSLISFPIQRFNNYKLYKKISDYFLLVQLKKQVYNSDYIWFTSPLHYEILEKYIKPLQIVIYDCMDDFLEFPSIKKSQKSSTKYLLSEQKLLKRSNFVFATSQFLKDILIKRSYTRKNILVVNNAISNAFNKEKNIDYKKFISKEKEFIDLVYIGTVSHWFNFDLLMESLIHFKEIRYVLIGPKEIEIPYHERIIYLGPVKHDDLPGYMNSSDALIMPFIVTDLIKSVNPVKLYEYISSGKPIITCHYNEINIFKKFVHGYNSNIEYFTLLSKLVKNELHQLNLEDCQNFLNLNTWDERVKEIFHFMNYNKDDY